jgi:hypothetical protein
MRQGFTGEGGKHNAPRPERMTRLPLIRVL